MGVRNVQKPVGSLPGRRRRLTTHLIYAPLEKGRLLVVTNCGPNRSAEHAAGEIKQLKSFWFRLFARLYPYPKL